VFNQPSADTQLLITDAQAAPRATISDNFLGSCRSSRPRYASRRRAAPIQHDPAPATRASPGLGHAHVAGVLARRADSPTSTRRIQLGCGSKYALLYTKTASDDPSSGQWSEQLGSEWVTTPTISLELVTCPTFQPLMSWLNASALYQ